MKLDILIVDFAIVAAVFVPYLLFIIIGRKETNKLKNKFQEEAKKNELKILEKDSWNNNIIGLDKEASKILLVQKRRDGWVTELINLREIQGSKILKEVLPVKIEKRTEEVLQRIDLELRLYNGLTRVVNLYNCEETYEQDYELKHSEKWNSLINSQLIFRPSVNSAA